jgi:NAD(P)-dependent dehydrogenase (short-subunit alcohol dehydrogenase family)
VELGLEGRVALVSAATRGIGLAIARALAAEGAKVAVAARTEEDVKRVGEELGGHGVAADLLTPSGCRSAVEETEQVLGAIDILVNCAGGFWKQLSIEETPEDEWDKVIDLNLKSIFLCARAAIPAFKRQKSGRIINIGSMAGVSALQRSSPPYAAAKAGVHSLTRVLALELASHGVTANAIAPGTTATERVVAVRSQEQRDMIGKGTLVGRIAEVSDMVGWVLFLASPEAGYLTGQTISVNGGRLMV